MNNTKKFVVLNGISNNYKAVTKVEVSCSFIKARVEIFNTHLMPYKSFTLILGANEKILSLTVDKKAVFESEFIGNCGNIKGVSVLIKGDNEPILYGESGEPNFTLNDLISNHFEEKNDLKNDFFSYDDEQLATLNYYEIKENEDAVFIENDNQFKDDKSQEKGTNKQVDAFKNEESESPCKCQEFYLKNKQKFDEIFSNYEPFSAFNSVIPYSKFARINYSENSHYIVGLVSENSAVKYLCYGVPKIGENPPKNLENYCKFIPTSLDGKSGYYLIFQCANSGKLL